MQARSAEPVARDATEPTAARPTAAGEAGRMLALQRTAGNQAVGALLRARPRRPLQRLGDESRKPEGLTCPLPTDSPPPETDRVLFPNKVSALTELQREQLDNLVYNWHAEGAGSRVRVDGYASSPGEDELNWPLSCDRAKGVAEALEHPRSGPGIPPELISVYMHGETSDFGPAAQNRRVSIQIAVPVAPPVPSPWWKDGPTVGRKMKETPLEDYVRWVREVERAHPNREEAVKRLRRLYYSRFTGSGPGRVNPGLPGPGFDRLIAGPTEAPPLTSPPLSLTTLNNLFATDNVVTPAGERLDPTHIFAMFDLQISGRTALGTGVETFGGVRLAGVFTWTGDLASWFVEWTTQKGKNPSANDLTLLMSIVNSKVSKEDLLSDMDAQIMTPEFLTTTFKTRTRRHAGEPVPETEHYDFRTFLNKPVSDALVAYYGGGGSAGSSAGSNRFARFVATAVPWIPHEVPDPSRPLDVKLASDAEDRIYDALYATAEQLLERTNIKTRLATPDELENNTRIVREIARRFRVFLETGIAKGDAPWP